MNEEKRKFEDILENRRAAMNLCRKAAQKGCGISGALFELESSAHQAGLGFLATTAQDFRDEDADDEMRPF